MMAVAKFRILVYREKKQENIVRSISILCAHKGCVTYATFNLPTKSKPLYCSIHKKESMIDVKTKKCMHNGCTKQKTFNIPGKKTGVFCGDHKLVGMINVKSIKCTHEGCNKIANFNLSTEPKQKAFIVSITN